MLKGNPFGMYTNGSFFELTQPPLKVFPAPSLALQEIKIRPETILEGERRVFWRAKKKAKKRPMHFCAHREEEREGRNRNSKKKKRQEREESTRAKTRMFQTAKCKTFAVDLLSFSSFCASFSPLKGG